MIFSSNYGFIQRRRAAEWLKRVELGTTPSPISDSTASDCGGEIRSSSANLTHSGFFPSTLGCRKKKSLVCKVQIFGG
jgi:hypothetical protein